MTITLHWWTVPLALFVTAIALLFMVRSEGSYMPFPSWHLGASLLCLFASVCIVIGWAIS